MSAFFIYLLKVIVCSALFACCYWCVMRKGCFHQWNRFFIVTSVVLSITIPALVIPVSTPHHLIPAATESIAYSVIYPDRGANVTIVVEASSIRYDRWALMVYATVVLLLLLKKLIFFIRIIRSKKRLERIQTSEAVLYLTSDDTAPFTFFRSIFWKKHVPVDSGEGRCMYRHELAHVRLGHSWDKTLMQLVCCLFWMNPFFLLFRRELELVHEFAADSESNAEELSSLILCTLYPKYYRDFTNRFFQSPIKRR